MRDGVVLGMERRRRWTDEAKLSILGEVGMNDWSVADVARRHDVTRQHIYQWRREMQRKRLWPADEAPVFVPVEMAAAQAGSMTRRSRGWCGFWRRHDRPRNRSAGLPSVWGGNPPFLTGHGRRTYAAVFSFWAGVMSPIPIYGRSLLHFHSHRVAKCCG